MPQVERREADASKDACTPLAVGLASLPQGVRLKDAPLGAPLPHVCEGNGNEGAPRALQTTGAAERWLNALPAV